MANWGVVREGLAEIRTALDKVIQNLPGEGDPGQVPNIGADASAKKRRQKKLPNVVFKLEDLQQLGKLKGLQADQIAQKLSISKEDVEAVINDYKMAGIPLGKEVIKKEAPPRPAETPNKKAKTVDGDVSKGKPTTPVAAVKSSPLRSPSSSSSSISDSSDSDSDEKKSKSSSD